MAIVADGWPVKGQLPSNNTFQKKTPLETTTLYKEQKLRAREGEEKTDSDPSRKTDSVIVRQIQKAEENSASRRSTQIHIPEGRFNNQKTD